MARNVDEMQATLRSSLVDAVVVDIGSPGEETLRAAALAGEHPSAAFYAVTPLRAGDATAVADVAQRDFAGILVEGMDDQVARDLVMADGFSARFARALTEPPPGLRLTSGIQRSVWGMLVAHGGRPIRTDVIAAQFAITREHLSRTFAANGSPNLKRVIDLVRVIAAAELAKNPGLDVRDVAAVLGFASPSHLSTTSQRIADTRPVSLSRLRTVDIVERFIRGNGRSRQ